MDNEQIVNAVMQIRYMCNCRCNECDYCIDNTCFFENEACPYWYSREGSNVKQNSMRVRLRNIHGPHKTLNKLCPAVRWGMCEDCCCRDFGDLMAHDKPTCLIDFKPPFRWPVDLIYEQYSRWKQEHTDDSE